MSQTLARLVASIIVLLMVLAWIWWSNKTIRVLWRRGDTKWGRLVYSYGVKGLGVWMGVFFIAYAAYSGWNLEAASNEYRFVHASLLAILGAILGIPVGLGIGYVWGTMMATFVGLEPDLKQTRQKR